MTKEEVLEEIKKNVRDCIETYSIHEDRYLEDMKDEVVALVEEGFKKLGEHGETAAQREPEEQCEERRDGSEN